MAENVKIHQFENVNFNSALLPQIPLKLQQRDFLEGTRTKTPGEETETKRRRRKEGRKRRGGEKKKPPRNLKANEPVVICLANPRQ